MLNQLYLKLHQETKLGGTRDVVKSKCAYCNTNKNKLVTKIIEDVDE